MKYLLCFSVFYLSFFVEKASVEKLHLNNSFVQDSLVYPVGTKLTFDYKIIKNNDTLKCLLYRDMRYAMVFSCNLCKPDTLSEGFSHSLIDYMEVTILEERFSVRQQLAQFDYFALDKSKRESIRTGIIEDEEMVWWHPFRSFYFFVAEFSPFPSIHFPLEIGNSWEETINVGKSTEVLEWVDDFEGNILPVKSIYKITDKRIIKTAFGNLDCFVVEAEAVNQFSKASLTSYYHEKYGFVRWEYFNIDETELIFDLVVYSNK